MAKKEEEELKKFIDEGDERFTGFVQLQILDQDGYSRKVKGSCIEGPVFLTKRDGLVILETQFPSDPLFFLQIEDREGMHLFGQWTLAHPVHQTVVSRTRLSRLQMRHRR